MRYSRLFSLSLVAALALLTAAPAVFADHHPQGPGGFQGPPAQGGFQGPTAQAKITTVAAALKAWDDTPVTLTGHIVQRMPNDDDDYLFRDETGEIVVDIDHKLFQGRTVTPETRVRLHGEVDTHKFRPSSIDVKFFEIL